MSQQTFNSGGTQLAEPPAPVLPVGDSSGSGDDNRRKLLVVGAVVGVLVLGIVAFFLMKGGSSSNSADNFVPVRHHTPPAPAAAAPVVKLPKHVVTPVGRDPFKALYVAPATGGAATTGQTGTGSTTPTTGGTTTTTTTGSTTTTPAKVTYHPVSVQLKSVTSTSATFNVWYSNGKTLKSLLFSGIKPSHTFASRFELLSIHSGVVTVKYGDGSPFQLDHAHNSMVVD